MMRFIKAVSVALLLGTVLATGTVADTDRKESSRGSGESKGEACADARAGATSARGRVVSIGSCHCGKDEDGWWTCSVVYTVRGSE